MAEKIVIASLEIDMGALIKSTTELKAEIDRLKDSQKELTKEGDTASEQYVQNAADLKALNTAYNANVKAIAESTTAQADQANQSKLVALALSTEVQSIKEARDQNALLNRLRNETNVSTTEGKAQLEALNKKLDENNAFIKENADQYLQQKINIGNYKDSIKEAFSEMNIFNGGLSGFIERSQEAGGVGNLLQSSLGGITQGVIGMTRASLAFIATPIGAVISAIGLVVGLLVNYLKSSQQGIDAVTAVTRPLQAVMSSLMGVLQGVGKMLFDAFSNPKKTMTELYEFVKQNLINRFTAFGKILEGIINLDFQKVTDGVLQAGTGVEDLTSKIQNGAKATGKFLDDAIKKGQEIDRLKKEIERGELAYQKQQIKTNDLIDEQLLITKDTSRTFAERGAAANEIIRLTTELSKKEEEIIAKKIKALQLEYSMKDAKALTIEEQQKMIDLEKQLDEAQDRGLNATLEQQRVLSGLKKEQEAQAKEAQAKAIEAENKRIENLIKNNQEELDLFIAQQGFKKKTTEEELIFNKQVYDKELANLKVLYDKGKISKLQYETDKLNLSNNFAKENADLIIQNSELELNIIKDKNQKILDEDLFLSDEILKNKKKSIDDIAKAEQEGLWLKKELGLITEQEYQDGLILIKQNADQKKTELDVTKDTQEKERKAIDLENKRESDQLTFEQDIELQREENSIKLQEEILAAETSGANTDLIKKKYAKADADLTKAVEEKKRMDYANTLGQLAGLFGEGSKVGKAFALGQATLTGYQAVLNAYSTAQKSPITTLNPGYPFLQAGIAGAFSVAQIAKIAGAKFEKGGIQEIGGKRHSGGGTKFYGEDGTTFEAERGEGIGILNRSAFSTFMDFNNRFGSGSSSGGFFQGGGIITQGVRSESTNMDAVVDAIASIPPPVVAVEEIQSVGNRFVQVQQNANL